MDTSGVPQATAVPRRASPVTFQDRVRKAFGAIVIPVATELGRWVDPNKLTVASVVPFIWAGYLLSAGYFQLAGLIIILGGLFDVFDGAVARVTGKMTQFGAFLDSVTDRISDSLVFAGLVLYYAQHNDTPMMVCVMIGWTTAFTTSYIRARAQSLKADLEIKVGVLDRLVRMGLIVILLLLNLLGPLTLILAILGAVTVWQRTRYAMRELA